jgi:hypothetical protein
MLRDQLPLGNRPLHQHHPTRTTPWLLGRLCRLDIRRRTG